MNFSLREWKQFRKLTLLIEGRIDDAKKAAPLVMALDQASVKINPQTKSYFEAWVEKDPSGNQKYLVWIMKRAERRMKDHFYNYNPDFNEPYVLGMLKMFLEKGYFVDDKFVSPDNITPERQREIGANIVKGLVNRARENMVDDFTAQLNTLRDFDRLVKRKIIRGKDTDINSYDSWSGLAYAAEEAAEELDRREKEKVARKSIDVIHKDENFFIFEPLAYEASCHYAQRYGETGGTRWCISSDDYPQYWRQYQETGNKFVFVFTKDEKFSIQNNDWEAPQDLAGHTAKHGTTVWDERDNPMSFYEFVYSSGLPPELEEKIREHYSDKYGFEVHDDALPEDQEYQEAMERLREILREDETVKAANIDIMAEPYEDRPGSFAITYTYFSIPIPKKFVGSDDNVEKTLEMIESEIEDLIDNNDYFEGYSQGISFEIDATPLTHNILVPWQISEGLFDSASNFILYVEDFINSIDREYMYDFSDRDLVIEDLPPTIRKIIYSMAVESPDSAKVEIPKHENFTLMMSDRSAGKEAFFESENIRVVKLPDRNDNNEVFGNRGRVNSFNGSAIARLANWISDSLGQEQLELGRAPDEELAKKRKSDMRRNIERDMDLRTGFYYDDDDRPTMRVKIQLDIDLPPAPGAAAFKAAEVLDQNWDTVKQILLREFNKEWPSEPLNEGIKKRRKMRIKFK